MIFISPEKLFSFSRYLNVCLVFLSFLFLVMLKNDLIRKIRLISKFMSSQPGKLTIAIYTLPNFSICKGNETMKFGQLMQYNMIKNQMQTVVEKLLPGLFSKSKTDHVSGLTGQKCCTVCFQCMSKVRSIKIY